MPVDIDNMLREVGEQIDDASKEVIWDNRELLESMGASTFKRLMEKLSDGESDEVNAIVQEHLLLEMSDEDLLLIKSRNVQSILKSAETNSERKRIAKDLLKRLSKEAAKIVVKSIAYS